MENNMRLIQSQSPKEDGELLFRLCQFDRAFEILEDLLDKAALAYDWDKYVHYLPLLLRISLEKKMDQKLSELWLEFKHYRSFKDFPTTSRTHYCMGIFYLYKKDYVRCHEHLKSSLDIALAKNQREDEVYARIGLAGYYLTAGEMALASIEIQNAKPLAEALDITDLFLSCLCFEAIILRHQKALPEALVCLNQAQSLAKEDMNLYMMLNIFFNLGVTHIELGQLDKAKSYLDFAEKMTPSCLIRFNEALRSAQSNIERTSNQSWDLYLEEGADPKLWIRGRGRVALRNQHLLIKMIQILGQAPGTACSKEELVESIWGEEYHPLKHDNKLYVTIKRLRRLIEINEKKPEIVVKNQEGYLLNPAFKFTAGQAP